MAENQQDQDQKTEQATPQRIQKARADGQVGYSAEFVTGVMLLVATSYGFFASETLWEVLASGLAMRLQNFDPQIRDPEAILVAIKSDTLSFGFATLAVIGPLFFVAIGTGLLQTNFNLSGKPLSIDWNKLSLASGFKRIFSSKNAVRGGLSLVKAFCIGLVCWVLVIDKLNPVMWMGAPSFVAFFSELNELLMYLAVACSVVLLVAGAIDLGFQKWKYLQDLRMSHQELKREHKETDGDPQVRARLKRLQAEISKQRMMSEVPDATVVVTNPTHFAVALKYDEEKMEAPVVVAKGADFLAKKIIELAKESDVPVLERKPVARYLYSNVEIGQPVPFDLYQAIAEIISFVRKLRR